MFEKHVTCVHVRKHAIAGHVSMETPALTHSHVDVTKVTCFADRSNFSTLVSQLYTILYERIDFVPREVACERNESLFVLLL